MVLIDELQSEVSDDPHEGGEVLRVLFRVSIIVTATGLNLDVFGQIDDETQVVELGLVNRLLAVIDEIGSEEDGEGENSHIVVLLLVRRS